MRYDEFRRHWEDALREARLLGIGNRASETVDIATMDRHHRVRAGENHHQRAAPFRVTAELSFRWDPAECARSATTEEDLLTDLLGPFDDPPQTMQRWLRLDVCLDATLPFDSHVILPDANVWRRWIPRVSERLTPMLPEDVVEHEGHVFAVLGWRGQPTIRAHSSADGEMHLASLQLEAWQSVVLPRVWDDPDLRDTEPGIRLGEVVSRLRRAYEEWMDSVSELRDYLSDGRAM